MRENTIPNLADLVGNKTTVIGTRTKCTKSKKETEVECVFEIQELSPNGFALYVIKGGVTGYESFCLDDGFFGAWSDEGSIKFGNKEYSSYRELMEDTGWTACAGTDGSWDMLKFSALAMTKAFRELGL